MEQQRADAPIMSGPYRDIALQWRHGTKMVDFRDLALTDPTLSLGGVYVIHTGTRAHRVGQATRLRDRLRAHQQDPRVVSSTREPLAVAWAAVPRACRAAVEAYLGDTLRPDVAERFPAGRKLMVNLPNGMPRAHSFRARDDRPALTLAGGEAGSSPSRFTELNAINPTHDSTATETIENDVDRLADALQTISWLHAKDAKNSSKHWQRECTMCATIADVQDILRAREEGASHPPWA